MAGRILIVEDERITAEDLNDTLTAMGYEVTAMVSTGIEAIREAGRNPPDLALMDIRIKGDMDGTETAQVLQERFGIPVIYLTAHADRQTVERAKQSSPLGYIVKPFQEAELHASLEIALHAHRRDLQARDQHQHIARVLSAVDLGIVSTDASGTVLTMNPVAEELSGWESADAVGQSVSTILPMIDRRTKQPKALPVQQALAGGVAVDLGASNLVTKEGLACPVIGHITTISESDGKRAGAVVMIEPELVAPEVPCLMSREPAQSGNTVLNLGNFEVVAASEQMRRLLSFALRVARSDAPAVLVAGERGTGKDLIAHLLHYSSDRRTGPFVPLNCSAMPAAWIEEELFGYEPGHDGRRGVGKKGLLEVASGGTLFLEDVGELSMDLQSKLLSLLKSQMFRRLGAAHELELNVRVIASTSRHLADAVREGEFRLELFQRLNAVSVRIPPLREHSSDIGPLAMHFLRLVRGRFGIHAEEISPDAVAFLHAHPWPGNIRELRSVIERSASKLEVGVKVLFRSDIHLDAEGDGRRVAAGV